MTEMFTDDNPPNKNLSEVQVVGAQRISHKAMLEKLTGLKWLSGPKAVDENGSVCKGYWCKLLNPEELSDAQAKLKALGIPCTVSYSSIKPDWARLVIPQASTKTIGVARSMDSSFGVYPSL